jgi:hypothetical protein
MSKISNYENPTYEEAVKAIQVVRGYLGVQWSVLNTLKTSGQDVEDEKLGSLIEHFEHRMAFINSDINKAEDKLYLLNSFLIENSEKYTEFYNLVNSDNAEYKDIMSIQKAVADKKKKSPTTPKRERTNIAQLRAKKQKTPPPPPDTPAPETPAPETPNIDKMAIGDDDDDASE